MRPTLSWADLPGRRVGVLGLGREGEANVRACRVRDIEPVLVDDRPRAAGVLATGAGGLEALLDCDVVIKTPGVSPYGPTVRALAAAKVPVVGGLGLWLAGADRSRVACITGTKGKSTTTAIAGHLLTRLGYRALVGGNIGVPPFDPPVGADFDFWIIEVSSYQAVDVPVSPPVVAVTSLSPDHLPWHRDDPETYYRDKLSLAAQPGAELTVANGDSALLRERRALLGPRVRWVHETDDAGATWMQPLGLLGGHNRRNALIAREALSALGVPEADDPPALGAAAEGFGGLESRLQVIGEIDGVTFVDDSLSTNVLPALAAVDAFADRRVALIVGGQDRGIDYRTLGEGLRRRTTPLLLLAIPENGGRILDAVTAAGAGRFVTVRAAPDLASATRAGFDWARSDGVVLLSPAAASFGVFRDYRQRGEAFAAAMAACGDA
ncbi:UDP-N-acetylmuramoyl-L-alanine--D-glutamate ligase [Pseudonocardia xishanensis]|uniref:UDP-N-acetylmuramoyl-L-alanine--L-glutamate ligase n=1 Tax=Pseudonocardia xishanensis TaxID=630995 RepID=A0ABP8RD02_9PSEU